MGADASLAATLEAGYGFEDEAVILGRPLDPGLETTLNDHYVQAPLSALNRHGLIAGATGTGKTKTLQVFAEQLSRAGVPVFLADLKGDLTGLAEPGESSAPIDERMQGMELPWNPEGFPVELLSLSGALGAPVRAPLSSFGPLLLAKVIDATPAQASVLQVIFRYADDEGLALLDLEDLIAMLRHLATEAGDEVKQAYGGMSTQTLNVLLRKAMELESQGAETFFGEPEFEIEDLLRRREGRGVISVLRLTDMQTRPRIFSTFMMWLLAELYETLPERGDADRPELVFFFDEAHLLFDGAADELLEAVELTVRMIRSKGVGVFFVTQQPRDVVPDVLAQLGSRIQHALRAATPQDQKALKATAATFPTSDHYDVLAGLTGVGTGEAVVSVLGPDGAPTPSTPTRLVAPVSRMDPLDDAAAAALAESSELRAKYAEELDRESAYEILTARAEARAKAAEEAERARADAEQAEEEAEQAEKARTRAPAGSGGRSRSRAGGRRSSRQGAVERAVKSAATQIGREVGRSLIRGLLGNLRR